MPENIKTDRISEGAVVEVGRHNHVIRLLKSEEQNRPSIEQKVIERRLQEKETPTEADNEITEFKDEKLLIIGNQSLGYGYTLAFMKEGYQAEVVSGHESYFKITKKAHKCDLIIFVTDAASHENYYKLKEDFKDKLVYANGEGANVLVGIVKAYYGSLEP